ncbi:MAG TPA: hypothetical protein VFS20_31555 [Longimicrobium sp.]|nr:hypothetical protein [Longimicrobium sp.]
MRTLTQRARSVRAALAALVLAGGTAACNDFLQVENPGAVEEPNLNNPAYITLMINGVIGEFQPAYSLGSYYTALFADELRNHHTFVEERLIDLRQVAPENGTYTTVVYNPMHRARFLADSFSTRVNVILGDSANRNLPLAKMQAYGGYSYVLLAEWQCEIALNLGAPQTPDQVFALAVARFDNAIAIANAVKAFTGSSAVQRAGADSVINLARVGAARAYLNMGNKTKAIEYASQLPDNFEYRTYHSENSARENNAWYGRMSTGASGSNSGSLTNTPFEALSGDPRVPRPAATERVMDGTNAFIPNSPPSFSTYNATAVGADFTRAASIRIASGLEARYIVAEATGPTAATIAFVEGRRTGFGAGAQTGTTVTTADNFLANLMDQRRRDFYLDGHRLGDMRRYIKLYNLNLFPTGAYPGTSTGETYGSQTCLPLTSSEINGNPNV